MSDTLPVVHNVYTYIDTDVHREFKWLVDGQPADLTDWTGRLRIGLNGRLFKEPENAVTLGGTAGTVTMDMPAGTFTVPGNTFKYVVDLLDSDGGVTRFVVGTLRVLAVFQ